eukprot:6937353-Prymnesium_polylepis.1
MDYGLWTMDCGLWTVDCGLWTHTSQPVPAPPSICDCIGDPSRDAVLAPAYIVSCLWIAEAVCPCDVRARIGPGVMHLFWRGRGLEFVLCALFRCVVWVAPAVQETAKRR